MESIPFKAPNFTINGKFNVRVVGLHDGDTMNCVWRFAGDFFKFSVRLEGIDTPEMTSKDPELKKRALGARNRLFELITCTKDQQTHTWTKKNFDEYFEKNATVLSLVCNGLDKYGRILGTVGSPSFSSILVKEGHAYEYGGRTKLTEDQQLQLGV